MFGRPVRGHNHYLVNRQPLEPFPIIGKHRRRQPTFHKTVHRTLTEHANMETVWRNSVTAGGFSGRQASGRQVNRQQSFQSFPRRQRGHAGVHQDDPGHEPGQKEYVPQDPKPTVGVDENATPVQ